MTRTSSALLDLLEAEAIHIFRETTAQARAPVLLHSLGKDSAVMLRLAEKAFAPASLPFPLLHVDTTWKFAAMYGARDALATRHRVIVHRNPHAVADGINPFDHGARHTDLWKTEGLKQALSAGGFDLAFGGARRDEDPARAKERVVSIRDAGARWDPRRQRPELWSLYNARVAAGESARVFPLSNWSERDVWSYIAREDIDVVPLYFATVRDVVRRPGGWMMVDDERCRLLPGEVAERRRVRFRTLGCYPLTLGVESEAETVDAIIEELAATRTGERAGRLIDRDGANAGLEARKRAGYF